MLTGAFPSFVGEYSGILSRILGGIHWRVALMGYSAGSTGELLWPRRDPLTSSSGGINWRAALAGYSAGSTGEQLLRDTGRDPLSSCSGGILTGEPLWRNTRRDPLTSRFGGILGGIHWRAALAEHSAGSTGELLWRDTGWGRGVEASQTHIPTYNLTTPSCRVGNNYIYIYIYMQPPPHGP